MLFDDEFVITPNHIHGIVILSEFVGATTEGCPYKTIIIAGCGKSVQIIAPPFLSKTFFLDMGMCRNRCDPKDVPTLDTTPRFVRKLEENMGEL